jgi:hypothetical protein
MKLNVIYTIEIQDGENRYTINSPQTIEATSIGDIDTINKEGDILVKTFYEQLPLATKPDELGWYEIECGCRMLRYKRFEIITDEKVYEIIRDLLYNSRW